MQYLDSGKYNSSNRIRMISNYYCLVGGGVGWASCCILLLLLLGCCGFWFEEVHGIALRPCESLRTKSGWKVYPYGLGGAARSTQPSSLALLYYDEIMMSNASTEQQQQQQQQEQFAPFYFYYNPHRYPNFMSGIQNICNNDSTTTYNRENIFVASGGTDRSINGLDQRLSDCLAYCGGNYLDLFILEYVVPEELTNIIIDDNEDKKKVVLGEELELALKYVEGWKEKGWIRYVGISTHSHIVGSILAGRDEVDALMLRYGMSHKDAAECISLPAAKQHNKPVIAFTSTRWNSLLLEDPKAAAAAASATTTPPTSSDCLNFVFSSNDAVEAVLHSARNEKELLESMAGLRYLTQEEENHWRTYGEPIEIANTDDFDEYPEERQQQQHFLSS